MPLDPVDQYPPLEGLDLEKIFLMNNTEIHKSFLDGDSLYRLPNLCHQSECLKYCDRNDNFSGHGTCVNFCENIPDEQLSRIGLESLNDTKISRLKLGGCVGDKKRYLDIAVSFSNLRWMASRSNTDLLSRMSLLLSLVRRSP